MPCDMNPFVFADNMPPYLHVNSKMTEMQTLIKRMPMNIITAGSGRASRKAFSEAPAARVGLALNLSMTSPRLSRGWKTRPSKRQVWGDGGGERGLPAPRPVTGPASA